MPYIGKDPGTGLRGRFIYTATAGQTSFTGADSLGRTLTYTDSEYTDVFLNGVKLDKTDYTATSGTSIVLDNGASADDTLEILSFDTFGLFSGEFAQDVSVSGDLTISDKIVHSGDTNTAIRFAAADTVTVETAGSERLRIDSSGNVGINETSLSVPLEVKGAQAFASSASNLSTSTTKAAARIRGANDASTSLFFGTLTNDAEQYIQSANGAGSAADDLVLNPFGGNVGINDTTPNEGKLVVRGDANTNALAVGGNSTTGQSFGTLVTAGTNTSDAAFRVFDQAGSNGYMVIRGDGLLTAEPVYNFTTSGSANVNVQSSGAILRSTSSEKYKQNIEDMELSYAQAILNLRPVYYKSKCELDNADDSHWGFIAEEVEKVDPRLVLYKTVNITYNDEGMPVEEVLETPEPEGVQYDRLTPAIVKLLQEQQKTIEALETKVAALEAG